MCANILIYRNDLYADTCTASLAGMFYLLGEYLFLLWSQADLCSQHQAQSLNISV